MQALATQRTELRFSWLFSAKIDWLIFYLPIVLAVVLYAALHTQAVANSLFLSFVLFQGLGLGHFHLGATWFHYLDEKNRQHYASSLRHKLTFVAMPIVLFAGAIVFQLTNPKINYALFILWTAQHIVQQNVGLSLLHRGGYVKSPADRILEIRTQHAAAVFFSLIFIKRVLPHDSMQDLILWALIGLALAITLVLVGRYLWSIGKKMTEGSPLNVPSMLFWLTSVLFLLPFAICGSNLREALLIPQIVHWIQYVGFNYVLTSRKYRGERRANLPLHKPVLLLTATAGIIMAALLTTAFLAEESAAGHTVLSQLLIGTIFGMAFAHYWQDSFIWRFREPFNREAFLPFVRSADSSRIQICQLAHLEDDKPKAATAIAINHSDRECSLAAKSLS